jgi:hypothetical protein
MGLLAARLFTLMCFTRVARGGFFMGPPAHSIVDINSHFMGRGPEQLIDVELSQVHQLSERLDPAP